jgi:hypothetical protein
MERKELTIFLNKHIDQTIKDSKPNADIPLFKGAKQTVNVGEQIS